MVASARSVFPFSAIVAQEEMKLALLAAAVDPTIGGVLVFGDRGTGKSTALRGLAALLPAMRVVVGCRYSCDPDKEDGLCGECRERSAAVAARSLTMAVAGSLAAFAASDMVKPTHLYCFAASRGRFWTFSGHSGKFSVRPLAPRGRTCASVMDG
jgi:hypothetical protein